MHQSVFTVSGFPHLRIASKRYTKEAASAAVASNAYLWTVTLLEWWSLVIDCCDYHPVTLSLHMIGHQKFVAFIRLSKQFYELLSTLRSLTGMVMQCSCGLLPSLQKGDDSWQVAGNSSTWQPLLYHSEAMGDMLLSTTPLFKVS